MATLHAAERNAIPSEDFAGPDRSFPIEDETHARAALAMAHYAKHPEVIKAAVHRKYPQVGRKALLSQMKG